MANIVYNVFKEYLGKKEIDFDNDTFKCILLTDSHTPSAGYETYASVSSNEVSGSGYTAGGETLSNVSWSESSDILYFDADNVIWSDSTFTARYAIIYDDTLTSPADMLMIMFDLSSNQIVNEGTFTLTFNSSGLFKIT